MQLGSRVVDTTFDYPTTLRDILEDEGISYDNCAITIDGVSTDLDAEMNPLENGFDHPRVIVLSKNVKGGLSTVKVCLLGGSVQEIAVEEGWVIKDMINAAGVSVPGGASVTFNGSSVGMNEAIDFFEEINILLITPNAKGGN